MDINKELEGIIEQFNIDLCYPQYRSAKKAKEYVKNEVFSEIRGRSVLMLANDNFSLMLIYDWNPECAVLDSLYYENSETVFSRDSDYRKYDLVLLLSPKCASELESYFISKGKKVIVLYGRLTEQGINCNVEFYRFFPARYLDTYSDNICDNKTEYVALFEYYFLKKELENSVGQDRILLEKKMFFMALYMRDFILAREVIETHDELYGIPDYKNAWKKILLLFEKIKESLKTIDTDNIIIYWLDALSENDAKKLTYLKELKAHSCYYEKAYTVTPSTHPSFKSMFYGITQVDDLGYKKSYSNLKYIDDIGEDKKFDLIRDINGAGYDFHVVGRVMQRWNNEAPVYDEMLSKDPCSRVFWSLLNKVMESQIKTVYLVHSQIETHYPNLSIKTHDLTISRENDACRLNEGIQSVDEQLRFYDSFLGRKPIRIFMSDHGHHGFFRRFHVLFQIYNREWRGWTETGLFSLLDFHKVLKKLMKNNGFDSREMTSDYVRIQDVDWYAFEIAKKQIENKKLDTSYHIGFKGIIGDEKAYVYFKNGKYYVTDTTNLDDKEIILPLVNYNDSLETEIKEKIGDFPSEVFKDIKFWHAEAYNKLDERMSKYFFRLRNCLDNLLEKFDDSSVLACWEGWASNRLLSLLCDKSRKKIGFLTEIYKYSADSNTTITDITGKSPLPAEIKALLLMSPKSSDKMDYYRDNYPDVEIIDAYKEFKSIGFNFSFEFVYGEKEDYLGILPSKIEYDQIAEGYINAIVQIVNELFLPYSDKEIAIRMGGAHTKKLIEGFLTDQSKKKINCIIDINKTCDVAGMGYRIVSPEEKLPDGIKSICVFSQLYRDFLISDYKNNYKQYELIDIYKALENNGFTFTKTEDIFSRIRTIKSTII